MLYIEFIKKAFQERYSYRLDFFLSIMASLFALFIQINVWTALFQSQGVANVVSLPQMLSYSIMTSVILTLTKSKISGNISERVQNGNISSDFIKPINFKSYLFAEDMGRNLFQAVLINLPVCVVIALIYGFISLNDPLQWILFIGSLLLGVAIAFYINYIIGLSAFWLETAWYLPFFTGALFNLFSGAVIPLWYYPSWLFNICSWLPFRFVFYEPIAIYLSKYSISSSLNIIGLEALWLILLYTVERIVWRRVNHRISVYGG
ncbi:ABC transporter permease [Cohnella panacarvi]|uniref:ABC transporter permease n=1 Tax=Cohnella panacarvi TaxID=400776 RepID=UPI00047ED830|nr:ABC-2 family transporter protein [Cohnella panacarvi]